MCPSNAIFPAWSHGQVLAGAPISEKWHLLSSDSHMCTDTSWQLHRGGALERSRAAEDFGNWEKQNTRKWQFLPRFRVYFFGMNAFANTFKIAPKIPYHFWCLHENRPLLLSDILPCRRIAKHNRWFPFPSSFFNYLIATLGEEGNRVTNATI